MDISKRFASKREEKQSRQTAPEFNIASLDRSVALAMKEIGSGRPSQSDNVSVYELSLELIFSNRAIPPSGSRGNVCNDSRDYNTVMRLSTFSRRWLLSIYECDEAEGK